MTQAHVIQLDARNARSSNAAAGAQQLSRYGYSVCGVRLLVAPGVSSEVILAPDLYLAPNAPAWLLGLTNMRGNIVPVFDLGYFIGARAANNPVHTVLIQSSGAHAAGLVIDELPQSLALEECAEQAPEVAQVLHPFLGKGARAHGTSGAPGQVWWDFDYQAFLLRMATCPTTEV